LPRWTEAAQKYQTWIESGADALAVLTAARNQIVTDWPTELEKPFAFSSTCPALFVGYTLLSGRTA